MSVGASRHGHRGVFHYEEQWLLVLGFLLKHFFGREFMKTDRFRCSPLPAEVTRARFGTWRLRAPDF